MTIAVVVVVWLFVVLIAWSWCRAAALGDKQEVDK